MKKLVLLAVSACCLAALTCLTRAADDDPKASRLMQRKLEYSQHILAGLASADYEAIAKNARVLKTYTQLENHIRGKDPAYRAQLNIFWFANDELIRLAEEKNIEGASSAFTQLTLSCVNCHNVLRDQRE